MDYKKIKVDPLFEPIKKFFEFYILGVGFISMPEFQIQMLKIHPGMKHLINNYNDEVQLGVQGTNVKASTKLYLIYVGRLMAISIFDFLMFSKYNHFLSQTEIYRFAKHLRNGAAHNNKFYFEGKTSLNKTAKWRNKIIAISDEGKPVVPDFITPTELIFLMSDISKHIDSK